MKFTIADLRLPMVWAALLLLLSTLNFQRSTAWAYPPAPATQAQVDAGREPYLYVTPATLVNWSTNGSFVGGGTNIYNVAATNIVVSTDFVLDTSYTNNTSSNLWVSAMVFGGATIGAGLWIDQAADGTYETKRPFPRGVQTGGIVLSTNEVSGFVLPGGRFIFTNNGVIGVYILENTSQRVYSGIGAVTGTSSGGGGDITAASLTSGTNSFVGGTFTGNGAGLTNVNGGILLSNTLWVNVNAPGPGVRGNQSSPYPNFTNAVNDALPGDTIMLYPGQTNWVVTSLGFSNINIIGTGATVINTNGTGTNFWIVTGDLNITGGTYIFTNSAAQAALYGSSTIVPMTMVSGIGRQSTYNFQDANFVAIADIVIFNRANILFNASGCSFASQFDNFLSNDYTNVVGNLKACDLIINTQPSFATNSSGQGFIANAINAQGGLWTLNGCRIVVSNAIAANRGIRIGGSGIVRVSGTTINVGATNAYSNNERISVASGFTGGVYVDGHPYTESGSGINYVGDVTNAPVFGMAIAAGADGLRRWSGDLGATTNLNGAYGTPTETATTYTNVVIISGIPDNRANGYYYWTGANTYTNASAAGFALYDDEDVNLAWTITNSCGDVALNEGGGDLTSLTNSAYAIQACGMVPGISTVGTARFAVSNVVTSPTTWTFAGTIVGNHFSATNGTAPVLTANTAANIAVAGSFSLLSGSKDSRGKITFGVGGTTTASASYVTNTFGTAFRTAPFVILTPANGVANNAVRYFVTNITTEKFEIWSTATTPSINSTNQFFYWVIE